MKLKIISVVSIFVMLFSCLNVFAADKKEVLGTDIQASVMIDAANKTGVYLNVIPPVDCIAEYAEGDYTTDDGGARWLRESPKYTDFIDHDITVKISGDDYYDTLFCFTVRAEDLRNIVSAKYDKQTKKLSLEANDPLLRRAYVIHAMYDDAGVLDTVRTYDVSFTDEKAEVIGADFTKGRLFVWKSFYGNGAMFPLCEKIILDEK